MAGLTHFALPGAGLPTASRQHFFWLA